MCVLCDEIKSKLELARRVRRNASLDDETIGRIDELIASYEQQAREVVCMDKK